MQLTKLLLAIAFICLTSFCQSAFASPDDEQSNLSPRQREAWLEWNIYADLRNTLVPGYIPEENEKRIKTWLGKITKNQTPLEEANTHVLNMDRATRNHDVHTENAEAKAASDILKSVKLDAMII